MRKAGGTSLFRSPVKLLSVVWHAVLCNPPRVLIEIETSSRARPRVVRRNEEILLLKLVLPVELERDSFEVGSRSALQKTCRYSICRTVFQVVLIESL